MKPHEPVIAEGGRRCEVCRLLPEEHPQRVFIAYLDTGGIAYAGAQIAAAATTDADAKAAVFRAWRKSSLPSRREHPEITTVDKMVEWFGIDVWPLTLDGPAERVD